MTAIEIFLIVYFSIALFIAIFMDCKQLIIPDPYDYDPSKIYWPPNCIIKIIHWWRDNYDPSLMNRDNYFRCFIWIDMICYVLAYITFITCIALGKIDMVLYHICIQQTALLAATLAFTFDNFIQFREENASIKTMIFSFLGYSMYIVIPISI